MHPHWGYTEPIIEAMKQQDMLRQAMRQSGQTRAQLATGMGVSSRTLDKWLLPDASGDFRRMPETALRLLANQHGLRKSTDLSMPYDWPNPAMPKETLILAVLRRARFEDVVRICADFGLTTVRARKDKALALAPDAERGILSRILTRMLRSIEIALAGRRTT
jgi:transcriptional regulator with XRE-family HTH domain